jgi:hypothetical protein
MPSRRRFLPGATEGTRPDQVEWHFKRLIENGSRSPPRDAILHLGGMQSRVLTGHPLNSGRRKIIDPTAAIGFDLAKEYALANQMKRDQGNT